LQLQRALFACLLQQHVAGLGFSNAVGLVYSSVGLTRASYMNQQHLHGGLSGIDLHAALLSLMCSKLRWLLPYYTADERRQLLDSCLNTRLLQSYMSSSMGGDAV
jgi:hypothetical protein